MKKTFKFLLFIAVLFSFTTIVNAATYYVTGDGVRVRSSAKNADNIIGKLNYGDIIEVVKLENSWYKIKYGKGYGYITYRYVSKLEANNSSKTIAVLTANAYLKKSNSSSSSNITTMAKNGVVKVLKEKSGWAYVEYNEKLGFVKIKYLKKYINKKELAIGTYTIYYPLNNTARKNNITKSTQKLNKVTIKNGERFSFINKIGKTGYYNAPEFTNTSNVYGGGISEVATSLFLALRDAQRNNCHVSITEQNRYGSKTPYAKLGEEAMINLNSNKDLVFTNKSGKTLKIYTYTSSNTVSIIVSVVL